MSISTLFTYAEVAKMKIVLFLLSMIFTLSLTASHCYYGFPIYMEIAGPMLLSYSHVPSHGVTSFLALSAYISNYLVNLPPKKADSPSQIQYLAIALNLLGPFLVLTVNASYALLKEFNNDN